MTHRTPSEVRALASKMIPYLNHFNLPKEVDLLIDLAAGRAQVVEGWHPINDAPMGESVIVSCEGWTAEARQLEDEGWYLAGEHPTDANGRGQIYPTQFMPLPAPPEE